MAGSTAYVEGLDQFVRSVGRVSKGSVREIRKELRVGVGGVFVKDVKARIDEQGLVQSGRLRGSIRPAVRGSTLIIRSKPQKPGPRSPEGYNAVYEFGKRGESEFGPRAFLYPTAEEWNASGKTERAFEGFLEWIERTYAS